MTEPSTKDCMIDVDYGPIKPCPFCGSKEKVTELEVSQTEKGWFIVCTFCEAEGPIALTLKSAQQKWNRRS
jgi:Lar family restriction alleviation protein